MNTNVNLSELSGRELIAALEYIKRMINALTEKNNEIIILNQKIEEGNKKRDELRNRLPKNLEDRRTVIIASISGVIAIICLIKFSYLVAAILTGIVALIAYLVITAVFLVKVEENPIPEYVAEAEAYYREQITPLIDQRDNSKSELQKWMSSKEVAWASKALSEEYLDLDILDTFENYIRTGRADNLKESINLFEEEQHRLRMEQMQRATMEASERAAASAESTAESARITARASQESARANMQSARANAQSAANIKRIRKTLER